MDSVIVLLNGYEDAKAIALLQREPHLIDKCDDDGNTLAH